jgi:hypothetical protein
VVRSGRHPAWSGHERTTVGYLDSESEFRPALMSQGLRDVLYANKINPIALIPNKGLIVYGQKTRAPEHRSRPHQRCRLVNYLRVALDL